MPKYIRDYTIILKDRSEHDYGHTVVVTATGYSTEDAANDAECSIALDIWKRRHKSSDPNVVPNGMTITERDSAWIDCMESVETVAVIEGTPKVYVEDAIFFGAGAAS